MQTLQVSATEFKTRLGMYLEAVLQQPIVIMKSGRKKAVLLSRERYEELQAMEDRYWAEQAIEAEKSGYIGTEKTMAFLMKGMTENNSVSS